MRGMLWLVARAVVFVGAVVHFKYCIAGPQEEQSDLQSLTCLPGIDFLVPFIRFGTMANRDG